jgi:hypothetical protein
MELRHSQMDPLPEEFLHDERVTVDGQAEDPDVEHALFDLLNKFRGRRLAQVQVDFRERLHELLKTRSEEMAGSLESPPIAVVLLDPFESFPGSAAARPRLRVSRAPSAAMPSLRESIRSAGQRGAAVRNRSSLH